MYLKSKIGAYEILEDEMKFWQEMDFQPTDQKILFAYLDGKVY